MPTLALETPSPRGTSARQASPSQDTAPSVTPGSRHDNTAAEEEEEDEWLMSCRTENGKDLVTLLSSLQHVSAHPSDAMNTTSSSLNASTTTQSTRRSFSSQSRRKRHKKIQPVTIMCSAEVFAFHVFGPAKQSEASIELQRAMFSQYQVRKENPEQEDWQAEGDFCINLTSLLSALQWLGPLDNHRTTVGMSYNLRTEIFRVELLQDAGSGGTNAGGVLCVTEIQGLLPAEDDPDGDSLSNAYKSHPVAARMHLRSSILRELLPEWSNVAGASTAAMAFSMKKGLEIAVTGHYGETWLQIPATGDHMLAPLELVAADQDQGKTTTITRSYAMHSLLSSMKGLDLAEESVLSINSQGIMAIQHKTMEIPGQDKMSNFVDFIMTCLEDEDDDDEEDDEEEGSQKSAQESMRRFQASQSQGGGDDTASHSRQSTTAATPRRRCRVEEEDDGSRTTTATPHNATGDDVDGSETEGESPRERQKRQARERKREQSLQSEEEEDNDETTINNIAPLFASVVASSSQSGRDSPPRRRARRSTSQRRQRPLDSRRSGGRRSRGNGGEDSDASKNMLESSDDEEKNQNSSSDDDEDHLDLDALANSPVGGRDNREQECASPELVIK
ncbi:expressed unknown protein [Seminavis robusta]|uniref:Uncharacterized protein n=1 Tax=Seminavis robusta TaxID=568900 RepID=A0A9N8DJ85_9STRA|nr:expressed unknown protein [Seminavis robusta]|eukprot:Sro174_g076470.1 n/a (618) ;mRNA; r:1052-2905